MCFGLYTLFADRVGKTGTGLDGLALSVTVAALAITGPTDARLAASAGDITVPFRLSPTVRRAFAT